MTYSLPIPAKSGQEQLKQGSPKPVSQRRKMTSSSLVPRYPILGPFIWVNNSPPLWKGW